MECLTFTVLVLISDVTPLRLIYLMKCLKQQCGKLSVWILEIQRNRGKENYNCWFLFISAFKKIVIMLKVEDILAVKLNLSNKYHFQDCCYPHENNYKLKKSKKCFLTIWTDVLFWTAHLHRSKVRMELFWDIKICSIYLVPLIFFLVSISKSIEHLSGNCNHTNWEIAKVFR